MQTAHSDSPSEQSIAPAAGGIVLPDMAALLDDHSAPDAHAAANDGPASDVIRYRLPMIAVPDNVVLKGAVQRLVQTKDELDALARQGTLPGLIPVEWQASSSRGIDLQGFVLSVVPFVQAAAREQTAPARLPLKHVLGDAGRWDQRDVAEPRSLAFFLASDDRASVGTQDAAEAYLVGALGLAWAHEGRSRPGFLRAMAYETMAARVHMLPYPAPGQLALYSVVAHGVAQIWCVLDRRMLRPLLAPWLSVPLLTAYGVEAPRAWPKGFPPVDEVAAMLATARTGKGPPEVDLAKVVAKVTQDAAAESWAPVSLLQVGTWSPRWGYFMATFIGLPSVLLVVAALALPGAIEAAAVAASLGFAAGAIGALAAPWVHARRKHLS